MRLKNIFLTLAIVAVAAGCTKVDDSLGNGFVLPDQRMTVHVDTLGIRAGEEILTRMVYTDSLDGFNLGFVFLGSYTDPKMGSTWSGFLSTFLPIDSAAYSKGFNVTIDSIKFMTKFSVEAGEVLTNQTFTAYALNETISREKDTAYYMGFTYEPLIDITKPLFSFKRTTVPTGDTLDMMRLTLTADGQAYFASILSDTVRYYNDTLFLQTFKGLAIVPGGSRDAILSLPMSYTYLTLYTHNYTDASATAVKDTVVMRFSMDDTQTTSTTYQYPNKSIALVRHNYTGSIVDGLFNTGSTVGTTYIQGLAGVTTELEFQEGLFAAIEALKPTPNCSILINQALIYFELDEKTTDALDKAPQRLGMYSDYTKLTGIPDYYYSYEMTVDSYTGEFTATRSLPYDGYLNRSLWYYKMNITTYIQHEYLRHLQQLPFENNKVMLAPTVYNPAGLYDLKAVGIVGSNNAPVKLKLTYTIIYGG